MMNCRFFAFILLYSDLTRAAGEPMRRRHSPAWHLPGGLVCVAGAMFY